MRGRAFGILVALAMVGLAAPLVLRRSVHASILGRYSTAYAAFLVAYLALLALVAWLAFAASERRYRAVFNANLLLLLISTGVALAGAEMVLRRVEERETSYKRYPPSIVTRMRSPEYDVEIATNRDGFRDVDHDRRVRRGPTRVAVIGDSFVWGAGVEFSEIMTSRLSDTLNANNASRERGHESSNAKDASRASGYEVMNFGVTGTGPRLYLRVWENAVRRYRPDIVIVAFYAGNDLSDAVKESRATARRAAWALPTAIGRLLHRDAQPAAAARLGWAAAPSGDPLSREALHARARESGADSAAIDRRLAAIPDSLLAEARALRINPFNFAEAILDPESIRRNLMLEPGDETRIGWPAARAALDTLAASVERAGAVLALACLPPAVQVDSSYWWIRAAGFHLDERVVTDSPLQDSVAAFARTHDAIFADLLPDLRAAHRARPDERLFFEQDGHWTPAGSTIAAQSLAGRLLQGQPLSKREAGLPPGAH